MQELEEAHEAREEERRWHAQRAAFAAAQAALEVKRAVWQAEVEIFLAQQALQAELARRKAQGEHDAMAEAARCKKEEEEEQEQDFDKSFYDNLLAE